MNLIGLSNWKGNRLMDANAKKLWVDALRSGKYPQVKEWLRKGRGFCALGVLCDISGLGEWEEPPEGKHKTAVRSYRVFGSAIADTRTPPQEVQEWAGYMAPLFTFSPEDRAGNYADLVACNDSWDYTFEEIAEVIENYF